MATVKINATLKTAKLNELVTQHAARPLRINDTIISGFHLLVSKTGAAWYLQKRIADSGKPAVSFRLGKAWGGKAIEQPLSAAQASRKAQAWAGLCAAGKDPRKEVGTDREQAKLEERERPKVRFNDLADYYFNHGDLKPQTVSNLRSTVKHHLAPWLKNRDVTSLTDEECFDRYTARKKLSISQARESLKLLGTMWNFGIPHFKDENGVRLLGLNPIEAMKKRIKRWDYNKNLNNPVIDVHTVGPFIDNLEQRIRGLDGVAGQYAYNERLACHILLICIFTGLRVGEARSMLWAGVDLEAGTLSVGELKDQNNEVMAGAQVTKNGRNHTVQMSGYVWALIRNLAKQRDSTSPYVFPNWRKRDTPMGYQMSVVKKVCTEMGIYFRSHAMRRTFRGVCRTLRINADDVKRMMNHRHKGDVTDQYETGKFNPDLMRQYWQEVAGFLETKRNLFTGNMAACEEKAAVLAAFLAKEGLTLGDGMRLIEHLQGVAENEESEAVKLRLVS